VDEGPPVLEGKTFSYRDASRDAKAAMVDLPASPSHVKVFDILTQIEEANADEVDDFLSQLSGALSGAPKLQELVSVKFGAILSDTAVSVDDDSIMGRVLRMHKAVDLEDLERQAARMVDEIERMKEELGRSRRRADMAVRLSNIFAFVSIVLALLLLISGVAADYMSFDWSSVEPEMSTEERQ